jgi:hypothetical protein
VTSHEALPRLPKSQSLRQGWQVHEAKGQASRQAKEGLLIVTEKDALRESFADVMREATLTAHEVERWHATDNRRGLESRAAFARITKAKPAMKAKKGY